MGSNIAMALYECDGGNYRMKTFINEEPTDIPGCPVDEYGSCDFATISEMWQPRADACDYEAICALEK